MFDQNLQSRAVKFLRKETKNFGKVFLSVATLIGALTESIGAQRSLHTGTLPSATLLAATANKFLAGTHHIR